MIGPQREAVERFAELGIVTIPLKLDGSKSPALSEWKPYQRQRPTVSELRSWFARPAGVGIVCGAISGGLEVVDIDTAELFWPWWQLANSVASYLPIVETPRPGFHVLYRCQSPAGNQKLAHDASGEKALIETRGEGGYIVSIVSDPRVHPNGRCYVQSMGPPILEEGIPSIGEDQRRLFWNSARALNQYQPPPPKLRPFRPLATVDRDTPWEWAADNLSCDEVLIQAGWQPVSDDTWRRPDKAAGSISAKRVRAADGRELVRIFTTGAGLEARSFNSFELLVALRFGGDRSAAAKSVRQRMEAR